MGFVAVVVVERRVAEPLLDLALFRIRAFSLVVVTGAAGNAAALATIFLATTLLQTVRGLRLTEAGLAFLAFSVPHAAGNQFTSRLVRFGPATVMAAALAGAGTSTALMGLTDLVGIFFGVAALSGFGLGVAWAFANAVGQAVVPPAEAGVVLTVLVGLGGVAVAVASSVIETRTTAAASLEAAIGDALVGFGLATLAVGALTALFGRRLTASP